MRVDLVTVPYRYDERGEGLGAGPDALLAAGLPEQLRAAGIELAVRMRHISIPRCRRKAVPR